MKLIGKLLGELGAKAKADAPKSRIDLSGLSTSELMAMVAQFENEEDERLPSVAGEGKAVVDALRTPG